MPRFDGVVLLDELAAPASPPTGKVTVYAKDTGRLYAQNDAGTEHDLVNNVFIGPTAPVTDIPKYLWVNTSVDPPTLWVEDGTP